VSEEPATVTASVSAGELKKAGLKVVAGTTSFVLSLEQPVSEKVRDLLGC
jgi:hypothetical protein